MIAAPYVSSTDRFSIRVVDQRYEQLSAVAGPRFNGKTRLVCLRNASQYDAWALDAMLRGCEGVPPAVLRELALTGLTLQPTPSQAEYQYVAATA